MIIQSEWMEWMGWDKANKKTFSDIFRWIEKHENEHSCIKHDFIGNTMVDAEKNPVTNLENELQMENEELKRKIYTKEGCKYCVEWKRDFEILEKKYEYATSLNKAML